MELKEAIAVVRNIDTTDIHCKECVLKEKDKCITDLFGYSCQRIAIDTVLNRLQDLENRYLHLIIGGRTYQILNDVKKLQCVDLGNNEFSLEVLEKWN